jgi:predicted MPP superfamily phosphohydrolase
MRYILTSTLPIILFVAAFVTVYWLYCRLWVTFLIRKYQKRPEEGLLKKPSSLVLHVIAGIGVLCVLYGCFVEPYWPQVNVIPIQTEKLKSATFRIIQISDTHCDNKIRLERRLPGIINNLKPDIIVFTGDSINRESALPLFRDTMSKLNAPLGKFAVTGNWDNYIVPVPDLFKGTGFRELDGDFQKIKKDGETIRICGRSYGHESNLPKPVSQADNSTFTVFLYHSPNLAESLDDSEIDLYLCGHTHSGQIALPFYGALTTLSKHGKKYEAGLYHRGTCIVYVNRGIGLDGGKAPKARFFARPEITVFDIGPELKRETKE